MNKRILVVSKVKSKAEIADQLKAELRQSIADAELLIDMYVAQGFKPVSIRIMKTFGKSHNIDVRV